jgi:serine/threonine protein kinase
MALEGMQLGRYKLQNLLGGGGMGEVYLAEDVHIRRQVAVKVIRAEAAAYSDPQASQEATRLFRREVRAIAMLDHPHILPLYDYGEETLNTLSLTYMVMPLRQGGSLATWLQQRGGYAKLSLQDVAYFIRQAASALQYAHRHNILHQDVKPSNFLIRIDEDEGGLPDLQLADFGIARLFTATSSMSQTSRGTPAFMPPEQWSGNPVTATDQYALAIMAYQLLTGNPPFQGRPEQVMFQHLQTAPQPPSKFNTRVPAEVDAVILRGLAKKPEERYARVIDFARAFQQAIQPISAPNTATVARITPSTPNIPNLSPRPSDIPMPASSPEELRATLAISEEEAQTGTIRTLTLPGGRKVQVSVPARVQSGHTIRLEGQGTPGSNGSTGALFMNIEVKPAQAERIMQDGNDHKTVRSSSGQFIPFPPVSQQTNPGEPATKSHQQPVALKFFPIGQLSVHNSIILIAAIVLILSGSGIFYFSFDNLIQRDMLLSQSITNPYTSSDTLALNDPLKDNSNGNFWDEGYNSGGSCIFESRSYHISINVNNSYHLCASNNSFSNFVYEVNMTILQGYGGGLVFDLNSSSDSFYYFGVNTDRTYEFGIYQNNSFMKSFTQGILLRIPGLSNINTGARQQHLLAVVTNNSIITVFVDHQPITSVKDSTFSQGYIGVAADDEGDATEVAFNNARVWTL